MAQAKAFPLHWPEGVERTKLPKSSRFKKHTFKEAFKLLLSELRQMKATGVVVSTNMPLKRDGTPYTNANPGRDHGVAVYFQRKGALQAMGLDQYRTIEHNMYALAKSIGCLRTIERYGSSRLGDQAFSAFAALPAAGDAPQMRHWREVLDVPEGISDEDQLVLAKAHHKRLMATVHPDRGGSHEQAMELNGALVRAKEELGG